MQALVCACNEFFKPPEASETCCQLENHSDHDHHCTIWPSKEGTVYCLCEDILQSIK